MTTLFTLSYFFTTTKIKVVVIKVLKYFRKFSFAKMCVLFVNIKRVVIHEQTT